MQDNMYNTCAMWWKCIDKTSYTT